MTNSESRKMEMPMEKKHFILVHGACHGAWSWFKTKPQLEAAGHKVNVVDLSGAGINTTKMEEINSLYDYSLPLMDLLETIPPNEKVILVGHSFGGFSLALAADKYPDKVYVAVFVAAFMPDLQHPPSYIYNKLREGANVGVEEMLLIPYGSGDKQKMSTVFAPNYLASHLYQLCSPEDLALAKMLVRPIPAQSIMEDLSTTNNFSKKGYGSVKKVYIVCNLDKILTEDFQRWQIENDGNVTEVMEIKDADHMSMLCKPQQLSQFLLEIADKYSSMKFHI